ncbi:uncharacterized protein N7477_002102 [Penicillium maclennaniae]|uniref:uncharacterized protein n=1 Tax=Penicillium maclennaniae TaxID=1343394 RepID=UPI0025406E35|nr:uncharacterized protein N7477_002102 [Penicillium maclennaniae]KAJ5676469.1 hypothetical protein N7477_002102 [Penicillium maclennaniae]
MSPFFTLPPELHILIADFLSIYDLLALRLTCAYLRDLIPQPSHDRLLLAESADWARDRDLYTCRYCLRLRPASYFADRMLRRRRCRAGRDSGKRFCIECGLKPREGTARYGAGAQITIQGTLFVLCLSCQRFQLGARDRLGTIPRNACPAGRGIPRQGRLPPSLTRPCLIDQTSQSMHACSRKATPAKPKYQKWHAKIEKLRVSLQNMPNKT